MGFYRFVSFNSDKVAQAVGERLSGAPVPGAPFKWDSK